MRDISYVVIAVALFVGSMAGFSTYHKNEDRKAYYACLALSEKLAEQQKQSDGSVRIVSLPHCKN